MKVLMLCLRSPYPPSDGGTIAMYNMARALSRARADVQILSFNTRKHFVRPEDLPTAFRNEYKPGFVYLDATVRLMPALTNLFTGASYNVSRFDSEAFHQELRTLLPTGGFDVIQLESIFMTPYIRTIRELTNAPIILRAHNVEHIIWKRLSESPGNPVRRWYLRFLSRRLQEYERNIINDLDGVVALTGDDKDTFRALGCRVPLFVSPIGVDSDLYKVPKPTEASSTAIAHLGSMDWLPNQEGVDWFLHDVYPLLRESGTGVKVHLAGKSMPDYVFEKAGGILHVYGKIDDPQAFFSDKQIMIVPLLSGGGMRVKIIEGMAMGKTIISTTTGAEGIRYTHGKNMLIADTPEAFSKAILDCVSDPDYCLRIGQAARELAMSSYENRVLGAGMLSFYHTLLLNRQTTGASQKFPVT